MAEPGRLYGTPFHMVRVTSPGNYYAVSEEDLAACWGEIWDLQRALKSARKANRHYLRLLHED